MVDHYFPMKTFREFPLFGIHGRNPEILASIVLVPGLVYAWGDNRNGQIGLEGGKKDGVASENMMCTKGIIRCFPDVGYI